MSATVDHRAGKRAETLPTVDGRLPAGWLRRCFHWSRGTAVALALISGCATPHFDPDDPGQVSGRLMVFWDGEDRFIYYPLPGDPLTYRLPQAIAARTHIDSIRPGAIYTDGGSIPRPVRSVVGFSPWGYGPAYVVHDWLFAAHHCIETGQLDSLAPADREEAAKIENVDFQSSADLLASVIAALIRQRLVPPRSLAPGAIYTAVDSFVARNLWDSRNPRSCGAVDKKTLDDIADQLRRRSVKALAPNALNRPPYLIYDRQY
jgi:hypothetical protein